MTLTLGVDPGKFHAGWALFQDQDLIKCGIVRDQLGPWDVAHGVWYAALGREPSKVDVVCVEAQQVYRFGGADPNDLIPVATTAGAVLALSSQHTKRLNPLPREWKGSVEKSVMTARIEGCLRPAELLVLAKLDTTKKYRVDVLDAIGLGLFAVGRLPRPGRSAKKTKATVTIGND